MGTGKRDGPEEENKTARVVDSRLEYQAQLTLRIRAPQSWSLPRTFPPLASGIPASLVREKEAIKCSPPVHSCVKKVPLFRMALMPG